MKNKLTLIFALMAILLLVTACGNEKDEEAATTEDGKTKLEMWTFVQQHAKFFENAAERWNKDNPDEQIELKANVLAYDQMHQKLQIALTSGTGAPDIADIEISKFSSMTKGNSTPLVPFNEEIKDIKDLLVKSRLDNFTVNDNVMGLDYHVGASVVFYNMDLMNAAGVNPDDIKTWKDYEEAGKIVKEKTGKYMTYVDTTSHNQLFMLITQQKADILSGDQSTMSTPEAVQALDFLQGLIYDSQVGGKSAGGQNDSEEYYPVFHAGEAASVIYPIWYMSRMVSYMPDLKGKIKITPLPVFKEGDDRSAGVGGTATVVTKESKASDLAKRFVVYAKVTEEGAINIWNELGFDPIRTDVWSSDALREPNQFTEYFGDNIFDVLNEISDEVGTISWTNPLFGEITDKLGTDVLPNVLEENKMEAKDALEKLDKTVNSN